MAAGIYIHIPFCKSRCSYCDFATDVYKDAEAVDRYVESLIRELNNLEPPPSASSVLLHSNFDTVYFGGGTPSLLGTGQLESILGAVYDRFSISDDPEITLEMNPGTVDLKGLVDLRSLGINRASFGVQTFNDRALRLLARGHDAEDARKTYRLLREAGFENVSFDLIAGLPDQTLEDWNANLEEAVAMSPEHISLYLLEVHSGTPLADQIESGRRSEPDEALAAEMYEAMLERLGVAGYEQYEISNFCSPGFESRHNLKYWELDPVAGFGVSAHSFDGVGCRWANLKDTAGYVETVGTGRSAVSEVTDLSPVQLSGEYAFLRLRLNRGLEIGEFDRRFERDLLGEFGEELEDLEKQGLVEINAEGTLRLTRKGRVFSNEVFRLFV